MFYLRYKLLQQYINNKPQEVYVKGDLVGMVDVDNQAECTQD